MEVVRSDGLSFTGLFRGRLGPLVLAFAYLNVAFLLSNYSVVWAQPEEFNWREYILKDGTAFSPADIARGLDWRVFEYEPRSTRPLSHIFEIADTKFRVALWNIVLPHPSLSLTWLFLLVVSPWLFFKLLRNLDIPAVLAAMTTALYIANPGTLSLLAVDFRPAKALANCAIVACLYWASRIDKAQRVEPRATHLSFWLLVTFMFVSFFVDETALLSWPAIVWFFPSIVRKPYRRLAVFAVIPFITYGAYSYGIPQLTAAAGFELPQIEAYGPFADATGRVGVQPLAGWSALRDLPRNVLVFLSDFFGLVDPRLAPTWRYGALWSAVAAGLLFVAFRAVRSRTEPGPGILKSAVALLGVSLVANALMHVVENRIWGLHWLNTYWPIFFLIFFATVLSRLKLNTVFLATMTCLIVMSSIYNFTYVNNSFKMFFYYRAVNFEDVIAGRVNRFAVRMNDAVELRTRTRDIWEAQTKESAMTFIPVELYYLMHDLRLMKPGASYGERWSVFNGHVKRFDMKKNSTGFFEISPSPE